jgi:hypothetical protein
MSRSAGPRRRAVLAAAGAAMILGSCTTDGDPGTEPTPSNTAPLTAPSPTAEPTPDPTMLSPDEAEERAQTAVEAYLALFDELDADPDTDLAELRQVAHGRALDWATHQITSRREAGHTGVGAQVVSDFTVTAVELDPDDSAEVEYPSVELTACVDISNTDIVDEDGNSVVPADRLDRVLVDYIVWNIGWPDDQQWRVVGDDAQLTDSDPPEFVPCP